MNADQLRPHVADLFAGAGRRTTRIAVEHELVVADEATGAVVPIDVVRRAARGAVAAAHLGFEPGGQVELSLPCAPSAAAAARDLRTAVDDLRRCLADVGVCLQALAVDPRPEREVPLQLTSPRYVAMQRHFDTIGPAGRRMMRRTASTQVCLDWWPGAAGLEQWRVLNLAAPFLAAAFARRVASDSRLATWLEVDPARTAFDERLLRGDDPVAAYVALAVGAAVFVDGGPADHLTTLFPPVRPRGRYLEVRFPDVQDDNGARRLATTLATLMYDDATRRRTLRALEPEAPRLAEHWHDAALGAGATLEHVA